MQTLVVNRKQSNQRIDKFLKEAFPQLPSHFIQRALRQKDIKANGIRIKADYSVQAGDQLEIYIVDDILYGNPKEAIQSISGFAVVYEDEHLLIVNKEQGIPVYADVGQPQNTLIDAVKNYLLQKKDVLSSVSDFTPALCHRLDRNTGGLVVIAKNKVSLDAVIDKMNTREIKKYYQCVVKGRMPKKSEELRAYLFKDETKSRVYVRNEKTKGAMEIITKYKVLQYQEANDISLLEVELVTGRTHQIRAHLAFTGHAIIGDGKYGTNTINKAFGLKQQALWAYKITFDLQNEGFLYYLKGKSFEVTPDFKKLCIKQ